MRHGVHIAHGTRMCIHTAAEFIATDQELCVSKCDGYLLGFLSLDKIPLFCLGRIRILFLFAFFPLLSS